MVRIICIFACIWMLFAVPLLSSSSLYANNTGGLPTVMNLLQNNEGVISIDKPKEAKFFSVQEVVDFNKDGYDDIVALGILDYSENMRANPCVYIIYGSPTMPLNMTIDNPNTFISVIKIIWDLMAPEISHQLRTGDIDGDGKREIVLLLPTGVILKRSEWAFYILRGRNNLPSYTEILQPLSEMIKVTAPSGYLASIYPNDKFSIMDINKDGIDDLFFSATILNNGYRKSTGTSRMYYILYGNNQLPSEIDVENTPVKITKILQDTMRVMSGITIIGDVNRDNLLDILIKSDDNWFFARTHNPDIFYAQTYLVQGSLFLGQGYTKSPLDLAASTMGLVRLRTDVKTYTGDNANITHWVAMGDINGDGYDDPVISFYGIKENGAEFSKTYVLFGNNDYFSPQSTELEMNIDKMKKGILKIYALKWTGTISLFGDVNGDGFKDLIFGSSGPGATVAESFFVLYGKTSFPDSLDLRQPSGEVSTVSGGMPKGVGDINGDGVKDIICENANKIFIILGRNAEQPLGHHLVQPLPFSANTPFTYRFADRTRLSFRFATGAPGTETELHLTNFGRQLPDSLHYVPTTNKIISLYDMRITNIPYAFQLSCSIGYIDSLIQSLGIPEQNLTASYWDEANKWWSRISSVIDTAKNTVSFTMEHLSLFALADSSDHIVADVADDAKNKNLPLRFDLSQNYPNPFNPVTIIRFQIPQAGITSIKIYNILGQEVKTVISEQLLAGTYEVRWDGTDTFGNKVASGIYIFRMETGTGYVRTRKMVLLK